MFIEFRSDCRRFCKRVSLPLHFGSLYFLLSHMFDPILTIPWANNNTFLIEMDHRYIMEIWFIQIKGIGFKRNILSDISRVN